MTTFKPSRVPAQAHQPAAGAIAHARDCVDTSHPGWPARRRSRLSACGDAPLLSAVSVRRRSEGKRRNRTAGLGAAGRGRAVLGDSERPDVTAGRCDLSSNRPFWHCPSTCRPGPRWVHASLTSSHVDPAPAPALISLRRSCEIPGKLPARPPAARAASRPPPAFEPSRNPYRIDNHTCTVPQA